MQDIPKIEKFWIALITLTVQAKTLEDGSVRVMVDLSKLYTLPKLYTPPKQEPHALPTASKSHEDWHFILTLRPDHTLMVRRPPALVRHFDSRYVDMAREYVWDGGVPGCPDEFHPPKVPTSRHLRKPPYGRSERQNTLYDSPLLSTIRYLADLHGVLNGPIDPDIETGAKRLWYEMWRTISEYLHPEATALAARYRYPWSLYRLMIERPDLLGILKKAPGIAPLFRELPPGVSLKDAIVRFLNRSTMVYDPDTKSYVTHEYGKSAAFRAWACAVPWSRKIFPMFVYQQRENKPEDLEWDLIMQIAKLAEDENVFDPNRIRQIQDNRAWLLFHTAVAQRVPPWLIQMMLRDMNVAVRAIDRILPNTKKHKMSDAERFYHALWALTDWIHDNRRAAAHSQQYWAKLLDDPTAAFPPIVDSKIRGFSRLCREYRKYTKRHPWGRWRTQNEDIEMLSHAPRALIVRITTDPRFQWEEKAEMVLMNDPKLKNHPSIRPLLVERATRLETIRSLLADNIASETKILWRRLAAMHPYMALKYLEDHGLNPNVGWTPSDLAPLFQEGQEIALRAMRLLPQLADATTPASRSELQQYQSQADRTVPAQSHSSRVRK